jgi:hypothetical protein
MTKTSMQKIDLLYLYYKEILNINCEQAVSFSEKGAFPDGLTKLYAELEKFLSRQLPGCHNDNEKYIRVR